MKTALISIKHIKLNMRITTVLDNDYIPQDKTNSIILVVCFDIIRVYQCYRHNDITIHVVGYNFKVCHVNFNFFFFLVMSCQVVLFKKKKNRGDKSSAGHAKHCYITNKIYWVKLMQISSYNLKRHHTATSSKQDLLNHSF